MKLKISLKESFERLTQREKNLIALLAGIVLLFIGAGSFFFYNSMVSGYEEEIGNGREKLSEIRDKTPAFAKLLDERKMIEAALKNNKITSLRIPLNDIAKRINADESGGIEAGEGSNLSDIISFEGKTHEVAVEKKGKKKGKKGKDEETVVEIEQGMELRDAPVTSILKFLDSIESSSELMFVTKIEIARRFNKMTNARANISVSTYKFAGKEEAEKAATMEE